MFKAYSHIQNKSKSVVLLLTLFFVMIGNCPLQKMILGDLNNKQEIIKQPKNTINANSDTISCSFDIEIKKASLLLIQKHTGKSLIIPVFLLITTLGLFANLGKEETIFEHRVNKNSFVYKVPLFLKNQVFII